MKRYFAIDRHIINLSTTSMKIAVIVTTEPIAFLICRLSKGVVILRNARSSVRIARE